MRSLASLAVVVAIICRSRRLIGCWFHSWRWRGHDVWNNSGLLFRRRCRLRPAPADCAWVSVSGAGVGSSPGVGVGSSLGTGVGSSVLAGSPLRRVPHWRWLFNGRTVGSSTGSSVGSSTGGGAGSSVGAGSASTTGAAGCSVRSRVGFSFGTWVGSCGHRRPGLMISNSTRRPDRDATPPHPPASIQSTWSFISFATSFKGRSVLLAMSRSATMAPTRARTRNPSPAHRHPLSDAF